MDSLLVLAHKDCNSPARAAALVKDVLAHPQIYSFSPFLRVHNLLALKSTEHQHWYHALTCFAYHDYQYYLNHKHQLPELNEQQLRKLRVLTIVSMASLNTKQISYNDIIRALHMQSLPVRDMEDLVIESIYAGLLHAKLDQRRRIVEVKFAVARDVNHSDIANMIETTGRWLQRTRAIKETLLRKIQETNDAYSYDLKQKNDIQAKIQEKQAIIEASVSSYWNPFWFLLKHCCFSFARLTEVRKKSLQLSQEETDNETLALHFNFLKVSSPKHDLLGVPVRVRIVKDNPQSSRTRADKAALKDFSSGSNS
jgi:COP9 signalosome complex subunit 7